jgi:plasmid stabilization system protein ParE
VPSVVWTDEAIGDLEQITSCVEKDSPSYAALLVWRLIEATDHLGEFPESGRIVPELDDPHGREVIYGSCRIMYRLTRGAVFIIGTVHGAREVKAHSIARRGPRS